MSFTIEGQNTTLDILCSIRQHKVDLVTRPDTDPVALLFRRQLTAE